MTHPGQRLSALIDGELDGSERERVLLHMARCDSCRDEAAALKVLKRRMNTLGEAAANAALTGRLMGLGESVLAGQMTMGESAWPETVAAADWSGSEDAGARHEQRNGRYLLAGALAVFLAGLGTAAFIVGGESQTQAPTVPAAPSVDVMVVPHQYLNGADRQRDRSPLGSSRTGPGTLAPSPGLP